MFNYRTPGADPLERSRLIKVKHQADQAAEPVRELTFIRSRPHPSGKLPADRDGSPRACRGCAAMPAEPGPRRLSHRVPEPIPGDPLNSKRLIQKCIDRIRTLWFDPALCTHAGSTRPNSPGQRWPVWPRARAAARWDSCCSAPFWLSFCESERVQVS